MDENKFKEIFVEKKSDKMEEVLDEASKAFFGRSRKDDACVMCGSDKIKKEDFKDAISYKEFSISHMCQKCQDYIFY